MKTLNLMFMLGFPLAVTAQNPIIHNQFAADPTARVFNNRVYVYPSHDIVPPEGARQDWFCMGDYHVFSSENLTDWVDHGVILDQKDVQWGNPTGFSMWAPDCVEKNGTYYFYFPNGSRIGRGFAIGVATAKSPEGPFTCEPEPIKGISGIDPCVLMDNDGQSYIYWSGMGIRGAKLKSNMKEVDGELQTMTMPQRPGGNAPEGAAPRTFTVAGQNMEGLPDGFKEGPFVFRRGDWYYLTFPWVRGDTSNGANPTETLAYAMSKNPLGPWDFKGIIMAEHANHCWTNHHSIIEYKGQWYLFYHHNDFSPRDDKRRSPCIDKISFRPDGTIVEVKPTMRGVGVSPATSRIDVDRYSEASKDVTTDYVDTLNYFRGFYASLPSKTSWLRYGDVDFSGLSADDYLSVSVKASANTELLLREGGPKGKIIARVPITVVSQMGNFRRDMSGRWLTLTAPLQYIPKGVADLCVTGDSLSIDWVQFKNRRDYFTPITSPTARPDDEGFIRRWMLLEPIDNPEANSNLLFSWTYLQENLLNPSKLPKPLPAVPRDGQKVKYGKQSLIWHAMESNSYNVRLFRFADLLQKATYRVCFWAVTAIDCPEDIPNVRLAAGSNGASMWWIEPAEGRTAENDNPVLTLESDRRMVADDGMSPRLTLKKGRNIIRCAVVNGPGLSDFCVRFVDEKGNPVTNFEIKN